MACDIEFEMALFEAFESHPGVVATGEDFEYRMDEWHNGQARVMFLSGLSGSGKTSLGRELAEQSGATLRSLDQYLKPMLRAKYGQISSEQYHQLVKRVGIATLLADNPTGRVIFEGGQICWMDPDQLKDYPVVVMGTSFMKSTWRAILRDFSAEHWEEYRSISPHVHTAFNLKTIGPLKAVVAHLQKISSE